MSPENPVDLHLWLRNGCLSWVDAAGRAALKARKLNGLPEVSVGRTDSKKALGFVVVDGDRKLAEFVLDRTQVVELVAYFILQLPRLKPAGVTPPYLSHAGLLAASKLKVRFEGKNILLLTPAHNRRMDRAIRHERPAPTKRRHAGDPGHFRVQGDASARGQRGAQAGGKLGRARVDRMAEAARQRP